jgi:hypothetical protein
VVVVAAPAAVRGLVVHCMMATQHTRGKKQGSVTYLGVGGSVVVCKRAIDMQGLCMPLLRCIVAALRPVLLCMHNASLWVSTSLVCAVLEHLV